jgi:sugar/nucleoside kinase (ribokinase family)
MSSPKAGETLRDLQSVLPHLDFFFPNEDQAIRLTGVRDVRESARMLNDAGVGCAVIKLGSRGALIRTASQLLEVPAFPVSGAVDTAGAGDAFAAGFLYARLMGCSLRDCALFGCATASCIVECLGASEGLRSREEVFRRFSILHSARP